MIILQAGQTIPDPNIFCDPQHFVGNFTVLATQRTVFYPNFFCDPQHFGGFDAIKGGNIGINSLWRAVRKLFSLRLNAILLRFFDYFNCFNNFY